MFPRQRHLLRLGAALGTPSVQEPENILKAACFIFTNICGRKSIYDIQVEFLYEVKGT